MESTGLKEGDEVTVKLIEIDKKTGKFRLSMKALQDKPEGFEDARRGGNNNNHRQGGNGNKGPRNNGNNGGNGRPQRNGGNNRGPRRDY